MNAIFCPDCGASCTDEQTCLDHFHTLGFWELDHQLWDKHHLMMLSYNLQHPHVYSPQTLTDAKLMLREFLETDISPQAMRHKIIQQANSNTRKHKITGIAQSHGQYTQAIEWSMTCTDVIGAGIKQYYASIDGWANSILQALITARQIL